jgi:hypothetical protein
MRSSEIFCLVVLAFFCPLLPALAETTDFLSDTAEAAGIPDSTYERQGIENLAALLNLKLTDLRFRDDYTKKDDFRLGTVAELMRNPYATIRFTEELRDKCRSDNLNDILTFIYRNLSLESQDKEKRNIERLPDTLNLEGINTFFTSIEFNMLLMRIRTYLHDIIPSARDSTFALLSQEEKAFLFKEFKEMILEDTADEFKAVEVLDSIQKAEESYVKMFAEFGSNIRLDFLLSAGINAARDIYDNLTMLTAAIESGNQSVTSILSDTAILPEQTGIAQYLGKHEKWKIGGIGDDYYKGDYELIIDLGGNDRYDLSRDSAQSHSTVIIDLSGNDVYNAVSDFVIGSGGMNVGLLYDLAGDDIYNGGHFSCGSGYFGFGLLFDGGGCDKYFGDIHTQGAGTFGIGLLIDAAGSDLYSGMLFAQGCGLTEGFGMVVDRQGNDRYIAGNKYKETLGLAGENAHYLSLSQGFGQGFRPYMSGGIGAIADFEGNDVYLSDIFGQGSSYWWALGLIYDGGGHDQYISYQYAQGAGIHMSLGILLDEKGDDFYRGKGLMQGCGHDYGCGLILDRNGNDIYQADDLSQAAGSANGFGILMDDRGKDAYYVLKKGNTQGYGNPRREFGSIGLFLDLYGDDKYDGNGADDSYWKTDSKWGGGLDADFIRSDSTGHNGE